MINKEKHAVNDRFLKIIDILKNKGELKSTAELLRMAGISGTGSISNVKSYISAPPAKAMSVLKNEFNVNLEYINTGKGPHFVTPGTPEGSTLHVGDRAFLLNLQDHLLKLEAKIYDKSIQDCISEFEDDTTLKEKLLLDE